MLAHDSLLSSGIGSSLKDKKLMSQGFKNHKPLADHLVDFLNGEPKVCRLEAGVLVRLEQGMVVHTLVEVIPLHLKPHTWKCSPSAPINDKVPVHFLLAFHRWKQERPLPPSLAHPRPFSGLFLSHFFSTPRSLRNDQSLLLSSNITLQISCCSFLLSACPLASRAPWLYLQRVLLL